MNKMLLAPKWLIPAAVCVLLCTLLVAGSAWAQTATVPPAPAIESLTPSDQAITVVWTAPGSDGGSAITSYDLRYISSVATDKDDANWTVEDDVWSSGALQAAISGLTNGTSYDVQARAVNAIANGAWSTTVAGKAATVPTAPTVAYAVAGSGQIRIVWSSPASDGGCLDGKLAEDGYRDRTYNAHRCTTRVYDHWIPRFQKTLEQALNVEDKEARKMILYGTAFTRTLWAITYSASNQAQCFECMRVCPVGLEYRTKK